jgi:hypothetical protein
MCWLLGLLQRLAVIGVVGGASKPSKALMSCTRFRNDEDAGHCTVNNGTRRLTAQ